jgi:hypothetical protein
VNKALALQVDQPVRRQTNPVAAMRWACEHLVWVPDLGMGYYPVTQAPYDAAYFEKYQEYAATEMGRAITEARVALVQRYHFGELIDVGIGCGDFLQGRGDLTWGYDVNPAGIAWLHSVGRWRDPYEGVDAISLWDCLEHIPEPSLLLEAVRRYVFVSLPIVPGDGPPAKDWKHLRRDEHCWYWTRGGFIRWMAEEGFDCLEHTTSESLLGREDIGTFVFRRDS